MLVLSRKRGEKIYVGEDIVLEVRRVAGNRVTVAIDAPKSVRILRGELKEAVEAFAPTAADESVPASQVSPVRNVETYVVAHRHVDANSMPYSI